MQPTIIPSLSAARRELNIVINKLVEQGISPTACERFIQHRREISQMRQWLEQLQDKILDLGAAEEQEIDERRKQAAISEECAMWRRLFPGGACP